MDLSEHLSERKLERCMLRKCEVCQQGHSTYTGDSRMVEGGY